ncbi:MAG: SGNH/GDSL hydrolase family protein [Bacteroidales bacterium]|nr:SGNH/GDSL hydrolase family protein [Bacteroidales bacterium]
MSKEVIGLGDSVMKGVVMDRDLHYTTLERPFLKQIAPDSENLGRFGSTITTGHMMLERHQGRLAGKRVLLEFGGNDCNLNWEQISKEKEATVTAQTDLELFTKSYLSLIEKLRGLGSQPVILSLPPLEQDRFYAHVCRSFDAEGKAQVLEWMNGKTDFITHWHEQYNLRLFEIARKSDVPIIDITSAFLRLRNHGDYICPDGIHPNQAGQDLIAGVLKQVSYSVQGFSSSSGR